LAPRYFYAIRLGNLLYDKNFFGQWRDGSLRSARQIVPLVIELVHPASVLDVGCGVGAWLSVFAEHGISELLGVDGDYVDREMLLIPSKKFVAHDLSLPLSLGRSFDLAVSLEVGEHLAAEAASTLVDSLVRHAPAVFFSAAVPFQGGGHHVNEQWPDYWASRFEDRGYLPVDCVRSRVWMNDEVEWWYAQNVLMFAQADYINAKPALLAAFDRTNARALSIVHPKNYLSKVEQLPSKDSLGPLSRAFALGSKALRRITNVGRLE